MRMPVISNWDKLPVAVDLHTVALIFGVNDATVRKWCSTGKLEGRKLGSRWIFGKEYLRSWIEGDGRESV